MDQDKALRQQLGKILDWGEAHTDLASAIADLPAKLRGEVPEGMPHSAWQLVEHIRLTLWDILEFSRNPSYKSPPWPEGYWPKDPAPPDTHAWEHSVKAIKENNKRATRPRRRPEARPVRAAAARFGTNLVARSPAGRRPHKLSLGTAHPGTASAGRVEGVERQLSVGSCQLAANPKAGWFVSGHDLSRAETRRRERGFSPCRKCPRGLCRRLKPARFDKMQAQRWPEGQLYPTKYSGVF